MRKSSLLGIALLAVGTAAAGSASTDRPQPLVLNQPRLAADIEHDGAPIAVPDFAELAEKLNAFSLQTDGWMRDHESEDANRRDAIRRLQDDVDALRAAISRLEQEPTVDEQRIAALEARVSALEARAAPRNEVQAPLVVRSPTGVELMRVDTSGIVTLYGPDRTRGAATLAPGSLGLFDGSGRRSAVLEATREGGALRLADAEARTQVSISTQAAASATWSTPERTVELNTGADVFGLTLKRSEQPVAVLGTVPGRDVALRLYGSDGRVVAGAGSNPAAGGAGLVFVGNGSGTNAAVLAAQPDGSGNVQAFDADGKVAAALVGNERVVAVYNAAGAPIATMSKSDKSEGGTLVARNPSGEGVFAAGYRGDAGGGEACVYRAKARKTVCLGIGLPGMGTGQ